MPNRKNLITVLAAVIEALQSLPEDALGYGNTDLLQWPIRDELVHRVEQVLIEFEGGEE